MINGKRLTVVEIKNIKKLVIMLRLISPTISLIPLATKNNMYIYALAILKYMKHIIKARESLCK